MMINRTASEESEYFKKEGFLHLSGIFSHEEMLQWRRECDRLQQLEIINPSNNRAHFKNPALPFPESIEPVVDISPLFKHLAQDERVTNVLRDIFGDAPLLLKDKLIYHLLGDTYSSLHQDWVFGLREMAASDDLIAVSFQIDASDRDNGCVELYTGYHQPLDLPDEERPLNDTEMQQLDPAHHKVLEAAAGDVLMFHPLTPHRNEKNHTTYARRSLYFIYNAARCGDLREKYFETYLQSLHHETASGSTFF